MYAGTRLTSRRELNAHIIKIKPPIAHIEQETARLFSAQRFLLFPV